LCVVTSDAGAARPGAPTAGDADELLAAVERERPDVVIADVRMPPAHTDEGIRAALVIRRQWPDVANLVLSQYVEERYAADLLSANTRGVGYLLKDRVADVTEFLDALRRVAAGGTALDPEVVAQRSSRCCATSAWTPGSGLGVIWPFW
jgi:DNA-binding NarL/FixJ family response regulator